MSVLAKVLGTWQRPADAVAWASLALAVMFLLRAAAPRRGDDDDLPRNQFLSAAALAAAFLSLGYVAWYLRGGPRIVDATMYYLQGRALSHGHFGWTVPDVSASFRGRFLLFSAPDQLFGIFPPGYPLLLAVGFLVGAPLVIGPALAAAIVVATYALGREIAADFDPAMQERAGRLAAMLSMLCAALRYHTADTMAHAPCALAIAIALAAALRARRRPEQATKLFAVAGLAAGYVACTRMVSALPIGALLLALAARMPAVHGPSRTRTRTRPRARALVTVVAGAVPGLALLALYDRAATGDALHAAQRAYYATSDGPPGCFRYGFGAGTGCLLEHGDFVKARMPDGYGALAALGVTFRRLRSHLTDVANFEPLALLVLWPLASCFGPRSRAARPWSAPVLALALVLAQIAAYAPFYFDGNYPGGGARFFADVLPVEHAIVAVAALSLAPSIEPLRRARFLLGLACAGFAVHASHDHLLLADREGGRPMFEPDRLREANVTSGLVFFETDHGFNLAHDPAEPGQPRREPGKDGIIAARLRNDDHDKLLYLRLGAPPASLYHLGANGPEISRFATSGSLGDAAWRFEAESDWPPLSQTGGWADPIWASDTCASYGRALAVVAAPGSPAARVRIELPVPQPGAWLVRPRAFRRKGATGEGTLILEDAQGKRLAEWAFPPPVRPDDPADLMCRELAEREAHLLPPAAFLVLEARNGEIALDRTALTRR